MPRYLDDGNWVPVHKAGVSKLPRDRPYTKVEAMFSMSVDLDNGVQKSIRAYSRMWGWSRGKVERFVKSALHLNFQERATNDTTDRPVKFMYVKPLRREADHKQYQRQAATNDPDPDPKRPVQRKRKNKPWTGLGKDLDSLLACDAYIKHLATGSPVLAQWSFAQIRAWARSMVDKVNHKRAQKDQKPISSPVHLLNQCASRVQAYERPKGVDSVSPDWLDKAADSMGVVQ